ncbi:MAG: apolipoprotein N-acyltransferase [Ignavibacteria bacterium]|nr:MAG: apolipoprotein N-acyltransferase [Ignavibacteria bacterium]KAF0161523.1 MAG: apolipoprotein N-acyltransferase [Ignavibacteria bacterium]
MKFFSKYRTLVTLEEKTERKKQLLLASFGGVLLGLSFPPIPFPFLSFFAFIPFFFVLEKRETLASINRISYVFLFFFCLITLYWVGSWTKEADPFLMISGVLLLFVNPGLYLIATSLYFISTKVFGRNRSLYFFPIYWVFFEYVYSLTDLKFPWLTLGNSLAYFNQFIQIADTVGVYGLSLIILYINVVLYKAVKEIRTSKNMNQRFMFFALLLFMIPMIYGWFKLASYQTPSRQIKVGLVQPNLNPWEKWSGGSIDELLDLYFEQSEVAINKGARIIFWPETALPVYLLGGNYTNEVDRIHLFVNENRVSLIAGMPDINFFFNIKEAPKGAKILRNGAAAYTSYNSIFTFTPNSTEIQKYQKNLLVPFGEKVPFVEDLPFLGDFIKWQVGISSWNVGDRQSVSDLGYTKVGAVVCIESIYPEYITKLANNGADFLAVVTNDSWYGYSSGPFQHKEISVLRAVENRRAVVRNANGGVSCIIDPMGRTLTETNLFKKDVLVGYVPIYEEKTFYSQFPLIIPLIVVLGSVITILLAALNSIIKLVKKKP